MTVPIPFFRYAGGAVASILVGSTRPLEVLMQVVGHTLYSGKHLILRMD